MRVVIPFLYYIGADGAVWRPVCHLVGGCAVCGVCRGWGRDTYGNAIFTLFYNKNGQ